jgi:hypothetical protein
MHCIPGEVQVRSTEKSSLTISSEAGWSYGYVSTLDSQRRTIWIADAHRGDGKRFLVRADEKLTAFVELEAAIRGFFISHVTYLLHKACAS